MEKKRLVATAFSLAAVLTIFISVKFNLGSLDTLAGAMSNVGLLTSVTLVLYGLFDHFALKLPFAHKVGLPPDLNGTWIGSLQSNWVDSRTGLSISPIPIMLTVRQTLTNISCVLRTSESTSYSYCAQLKELNPDSYVLRYDYSNKPGIHIKHRSPDHDGTAKLDVKISPNKVLVGSYLTERDTKGLMQLTFYSDDRLDSLPAGLEAHPVTKTDENIDLSPLTPPPSSQT